MRKHVDRETGEVCSVTLTAGELRRRRRRQRHQGRIYVWVSCEVRGRVRVCAEVVPDGSPAARAPRGVKGRR